MFPASQGFLVVLRIYFQIQGPRLTLNSGFLECQLRFTYFEWEPCLPGGSSISIHTYNHQIVTERLLHMRHCSRPRATILNKTSPRHQSSYIWGLWWGCVTKSPKMMLSLWRIKGTGNAGAGDALLLNQGRPLS